MSRWVTDIGGGTHLEVATVEGTVRIDDHQSDLPTEHVTFIRLVMHLLNEVTPMTNGFIASGTVVGLPQC